MYSTPFKTNTGDLEISSMPSPTPRVFISHYIPYHASFVQNIAHIIKNNGNILGSPSLPPGLVYAECKT